MKNEALAMKQVVNAINFDVHCGLNEVTGERYIERITEVVPTQGEDIFKTVDIVTFHEKEGKYRINNPISQGAMEEMDRFVPKEARAELEQIFKEALHA